MNAQTRPNLPIRATYGEKDNMHTLLSCSGDERALPPALAGFTDKPQGHLAPGERWWPSVGCGPFDDWWAIWWSVPDDHATRAGMARAEVALWPIDEVSDIDDLSEVMKSLNGHVTVPHAPKEILAAAAEALIRDVEVPVVADLQIWPGVLMGLWPKLWPEARREFSAWVTLSPPQVGDSKYSPWLYAVPAGREKQWPSHVVVSSLTSPIVSRGARWLMGERDTTLDELLAECPFPDGSATHLNRVARAAERLDKIRSSPDTATGTELARTLAAIDSRPTGAVRLKEEALCAVGTKLACASLLEIRALANLDARHYPTEAMPSTALREWLYRQLPSLATADLETALNVFITGKAEPWWLNSFHNALHDGLNALQPAWCTLALFWMCNISDLSKLSPSIVDSSQFEHGVINVFSSGHFTNEQLQTLRHATRVLRLSRLHALAVWRSLTPIDALREQLRFPITAWDGVELLLQQATDEDVVRSAVELEDLKLLKSAARLSIANPSLLISLNLNAKGWRQLWAVHVAGGGVPWPNGVDRDVEASKFLHGILDDHYEPGPIAKLAPDFAKAALEMPERERLWSRLQANEAKLLEEETAKKLLTKLEQGEEISPAERELSNAVLGQAGHRKLSVQTIITLVSWNPTLDQQVVRDWIRQTSLNGEAGQKMGKIIRNRHWNNIVNDLYVRFISGEREVLSALSECRDQLWWWERIYVPHSGAGAGTTPTKEDIVRRAGELGGNLAPSSLDDIWERAGGSLKVLKAYGTPGERWNHACRKASDGALAGGLLALIEILIHDLPNNDHLIELRRALVQSPC